MARKLEDRTSSYEAMLNTPAGKDVLADLVIFAQQEKDPVRALGKADVVLRMLREQTRSKLKEKNDGSDD